MPRRDGTGPMGIGSMTCRRSRLINNNNRYGRRYFDFKYDYDTNKEVLQKQKEILETKLKAIEEQLNDYNVGGNI